MLVENKNLQEVVKNVFFCSIVTIFLISCEEENTKDLEPEETYLYSFFVAGHTYGTPGVDNVGFHPPFKEKFCLIQDDKRIKFGVLTGDVVLSSTEINWNEVDEDIALLIMPVHIAVGNHDIGKRELYESRYGATYYSFIHNSDMFLILDPNIDHWNISNQQLDFVKNEISTIGDTIDNIFVFFHQLLWWTPDNIYRNVTPNSFAGRDDEINFWDDVEPLFYELSLPVYMFAGDVGAFATGDEFMYHNYDNITLIASGMGGGERDNFIIVDVHKDKLVSFRLIALNGNDINALGNLEDYILE